MSNPMYYCRGSRKEDTEGVIRAIQSAFGKDASLSFSHTLATRLSSYDENRIILKKENNHEEVVGACPIFRYPFHFGNLDLKAGGIFYFGITDTLKRKGLGQLLLDDCNHYLTSLGWDANFLYTGSPGFYRHKGYEIGVRSPEYLLQIEKIPSSRPISDEISITNFQRPDIPAIAEIYELFNRTMPMTRIRTESYWNHNYQDNPNRFEKNILTIRFQKKIVGYIWIIQSKQKMHIPEFGLDPRLAPKIQNQIFDAIFSELKSIGEKFQLKNLSIGLFQKCAIVKHMIQLGAKENTAYITGFMLTIYNLSALIPKIIQYQQDFIIPNVNLERFDRDLFPFTLQIEDQSITYAIKENQIEICHNQEISKPKLTISIPRSKFGTMVFGNMPPSELVENEYWTCSSELLPILDQIFPPIEGIVYPLDRF